MSKMTITLEQFARCTGAQAAIAGPWLDPIRTVMALRQVSTPKRMAAFLGQIGVESQQLTRTRENLNYTPEALMRTFNHENVIRFTKTDAYRYGRTAEHPANQQMIANIAYAGRMGNGPPESGRGWLYRAGGPGGLTGHDNYAACGKAIGVDLIGHPELIVQPDIGAAAFGWFWDSQGLNDLADHGDIVGISGAINAGNSKTPAGRINGLPERIEQTKIALQVLS